MKRIAIIHFQPLEIYPPAVNFINFISCKSGSVKVKVFSTKTTAPVAKYRFDSAIDVYRIGTLNQSRPKICRAGHYFLYYFSVFFHLLFYRPTDILYYETLSFLPVYWYIYIMGKLGRQARVFCHYHEYISATEYEKGIFLNRRIHSLEKRKYPMMAWISHTNMDRMRMFIEDNLNVNVERTYILPNYPPLYWRKLARNQGDSSVLSVVYAGALGMDTMFIKEFADWVNRQNGSVIWDIYSWQSSHDLLEYLSKTKNQYVQFKGHVNYDNLPATLNKYQVGVILYKGHIPNYIYNAPNKLFEYLAVGLDVWYPKTMIGIKEYVRDSEVPKVLELDYENMNDFDFRRAIDKMHLPIAINEFYAENAFRTFEEKIMEE